MMLPISGNRERAGGLGGGGRKNLFFGVVVVEVKLVRRFAQEYGTPGASFLHRAEE
jgi:hypothetical protein